MDFISNEIIEILEDVNESRTTILPGTAIVLEGGEGTGKGTIAQSLKNRIEDYKQEYGLEDLSVCILREPGGSEKSEKIRELILADDMEGADSLTECLLYAAARRELFLNVLKPLLMNPKQIVILDRFVYSSYVYQGLLSNPDNLKAVIDINDVVLDNWKPDIAFCLDVPTDITHERMLKDNNRVLNRFDVRDNDFHEKIRDAYASLIILDEYYVLNADDTIENITEKIMKVITPIIQLKIEKRVA